MPEGIGYGSVASPVSVETSFGRGATSTADKLQEQNGEKQKLISQSVARQADINSSRANQLERQSQVLENRGASSVLQAGLGNRVDFSV